MLSKTFFIGLTLLLDAHSNKLGRSSVIDDFDGFVAMVGKRNSYPLIDQEPIIIRPGHVNFVAISSRSIKSNDGIRDIDIEHRKCYFNDERLDNLTIHNHYTQSNCLLECTIASVQQKFNKTCVPWYLPPLNDSQHICDPYDNAKVCSINIEKFQISCTQQYDNSMICLYFNK